MKRFAKTIVYVLLLMVIPTRISAQDNTPNRAIGTQDANTNQTSQIREYENGFLFNVFEIENVEERVQLASALATSDIWICNPTENPGELYIRPNSAHADLPIYAEFDYLRMTLREEYEEASSLPKEEFAEIYKSWARNISSMYYNFLISDHLDRANHCMDAEPFCTSDVYNFPALNSGYSWSGPNYGCLRESPTNKHSFWYYMRIGVAGNITIYIEATFDVDFALWGPFDNQNDPCPTEAGQSGMLTATCESCPNNTSSTANYPYGNLHDCSFDARHFEYAHVVNGQVGQYYILLITNYSGSDGYITFQKYDGDGETDCGIMPGIATNDGPYCEGETIHLNVNEQNNATYAWTGPDGWTSSEPHPTRPNCTLAMGGTYSIVTTVGAQTTPATTEVVVYRQPTPSFNATSVCQGETTNFEGIATGTNVANYDWDFGDGSSGSGQNVSHTYAEAGTYQATLTVTAEGGACPGEITQPVTVYAVPVPTVSANPASVMYGGTSTISVEVEPAGNYSFHWEPANMVTDPDSQTTQTVAIEETQIFTVTVTNLEGGCTSTAQVPVVMAGSNMTAMISADQTTLCEDESTTLHAIPLAGTGVYEYSWTPSNTLSNPTVQDPVATPPVGTTTYNCVISDGLTTQEVSIEITVNPKKESDMYEAICENGTYNFYGQILNTAGVYDHTLETSHHCDSVVHLHLSLNELDETFPPDIETCNEYFWDPQGHEIVETDHSDLVYNVSNTYHRTYLNQLGCDSIVTLRMHFDYTPSPTEIYPIDASNEAPHWVVTATEFQINSYDFHLWDTNPSCYWDTVTWNFTEENDWVLEPFGDRGTSCKMYVLNYIEDTIWLEAHPKNDCNPHDSVVQRYWFVCSFYDVNDNALSASNFFVVPNPNNGQMQLHFEQLEGKAEVKVYDMKGILIDRFETYNDNGRFSYPYDMKSYADGIYLFIVTTKEGTISKKVVLQR